MKLLYSIYYSRLDFSRSSKENRLIVLMDNRRSNTTHQQLGVFLVSVPQCFVLILSHKFEVTCDNRETDIALTFINLQVQ